MRVPETVRFLELQIASNLGLLGYAAAAEARYRRSFQLYPDNVFSNLAWPTFLYEHGRIDEAPGRVAAGAVARHRACAAWICWPRNSPSSRRDARCRT